MAASLSASRAAVERGIALLKLYDATEPERDAVASANSLAAALPPDVMHRIFTPLDRDMRSLSAAACVCTSWRAAALDPSHWRLKCLTLAPRAARRLTDGALAALVRRTGDTLERVILVGCTYVSAAGVAAALKGKKLKTLAVRGVRVGARQPKAKANATFANLQALVCRPSGLDIRKGMSCGCTYTNANGDTKSCLRLCGPQDVLCSTCDLVRCKLCTAAAKSKREPPCNHLCDGCFAPCNQHERLFACMACGRVPNGFCASCMITCDFCDDADYCTTCSSSGGTLTKCAEPDCSTFYCDADRPDPQCDACGKSFCKNCFVDSLEMCSICGRKYYCDECMWSFMDGDGDEVICADCMGDFWDSSGSDGFWTDEDED
jgi:hypothetical protein